MKTTKWSLLVTFISLAALLLLSSLNQSQSGWQNVIASLQSEPLEEAPEDGSFWMLQRANDPPLPFNPFPELPVYYQGYRNDFLVDDLSVDYEALYKEIAQQQELLRLAWEAGLVSTEEYWELGGGQSAMMSSLMSAHSYDNPVWLLDFTTVGGISEPTTASFSIAGGTNLVPYDILMSTDVAASIEGWSWLGIGYTSNRYSFSNQPEEHAFYILAKPQQTMVAGWGTNSLEQCDVPHTTTNALMAAAGVGHSLILLSDGSVAAWGNDLYGQASVPTNLSGVAMIAAGWYHISRC